ncbi:MAG: PQQ-binding-like beta-propeller repeat protein [Fibrobacteres bacterium]|nr:PQQ-binding-like beta-propeller repeat protein [Fibrobacterota bacterium]
MRSLFNMMLFVLFVRVCLANAEERFSRFHADQGGTGVYQDTLLKPPLKVKWRYFTEGSFKGSPIIHEGRLFTADRQGQVYCLDAESGRLLWKKYFLSAGNFNFKEMTIPLAYGDFLYVHYNAISNNNRKGWLTCLRISDGSEVWTVSNIGQQATYRAKSSPLCYKGKIYFLSDHIQEDTTIRLQCLDAQNGQSLWTRPWGPFHGANGYYGGDVVLCTLKTPAVIAGCFGSIASENWHPKFGRSFAVTADSGKLLWENPSIVCGNSQNLSLRDSIFYVGSNSVEYMGLVAANVWTGVPIWNTSDGTYKVTLTDKFVMGRGYGGDAFVLNRMTGAKVSTGLDWSRFDLGPFAGKGTTGCGYVSIANGFGYCGFGHMYQNDTVNTPPGYYPRAGKGQGIYAFEVPTGFTPAKLKVCWFYRTASNICSTPAVWNGKLYVTTNNEGAIYCFENDR